MHTRPRVTDVAQGRPPHDSGRKNNDDSWEQAAHRSREPRLGGYLGRNDAMGDAYRKVIALSRR